MFSTILGLVTPHVTTAYYKHIYLLHTVLLIRNAWHFVGCGHKQPSLMPYLVLRFQNLVPSLFVT